MKELYSEANWHIFEQSASLPDGREKRSVRASRPDSVHILAFSSEDTVVLLREFRPFYGEYLWMLPSGRVDKEQDHALAAQRELQEEAGFRSNNLQYWCCTQYSESLIATNYLYIASDLENDPLPQDDDELIEVHHVPVAEALSLVLESPIVHTASAFGLLRYLHEHS